MTSTTDANADAPTPDGYGALRAQLDTLTTEAFRPELAEIDQLPTQEIARIMNGEDTTVPAAVAEKLPQIAAAIDATAERMARGGRLIYAGAGTAGRLGVLDASECPPTFNTDPSEVIGLIAGGPSAMVKAVEGAEDSKELAAADLDALGLTADDTVVGISASGRTPYAIGAVEHARGKGALTIGLSCNAGSGLAAAAEHGLEIVVGPELLTGSTRLKAGTAQARPQHALDDHDDPARQDLREPHGRRARVQREAARPLPPDRLPRHRRLRRGDRDGARRHRRRGQERHPHHPRRGRRPHRRHAPGRLHGHLRAALAGVRTT